MKPKDFTLTFSVKEPPDKVSDAISDVRSWWSGEFEGSADRAGAEFVYRYKDMHRSRQRVAELVRGKKIVWKVLDARLSFVRDSGEWDGTEIVFELSREGGGTTIRFTHVGLDSTRECYETCSSAWGTLLTGNLRRRIVTGERQADALATG